MPKTATWRIIPGLVAVVNNLGDRVRPLRIGLWDPLYKWPLNGGDPNYLRPSWDDPPSTAPPEVQQLGATERLPVTGPSHFQGLLLLNFRSGTYLFLSISLALSLSKFIIYIYKYIYIYICAVCGAFDSSPGTKKMRQK